MTVATTVAGIKKVQNCLNVLYTYLQLTAYMFAPDNLVLEETTFDYIVIGGGSSGSVIASRLSEDPNVTVLLLEAGGNPPIHSQLPGLILYLKDSNFDWKYKQENINRNFFNEDLATIMQGKMLGGTSGLNFMTYVRGAPGEYDSWAKTVKDDNWNFENLLNFFMKSEDFQNIDILKPKNSKYHGTKGPMGVIKQDSNETHIYLKAFKELGHEIIEDVNGEDALGYTQPMFTIADEMRQSTAFSFLSKIKNRRNLIVQRNTLVTKILFDKNNRAIGVKALRNGKSVTFYSRREVVVSAGPFGSPKLLMLSGIGPKQHLNDLNIKCISDVPVGSNLQEHSRVPIVFKMEKLTYSPHPYNPHEFPEPAVFGSVALDPKQHIPDYHSLSFINSGKTFLKYCLYTLGYSHTICDAFYQKAAGSEIFVSLITLLHPKSRGQVTLNSTDPHDSPVIKLNRFSNKEDLENFITYVQHYIEVANTKTFEQVGGKLMYIDLPGCNAKHGSREYWQCYISGFKAPLFEFAGACIMGSVVDTKLRVKGVENVVVADASIIPLITSGRMNIPAIMIGEKAAYLIKTYVKKESGESSEKNDDKNESSDSGTKESDSGSKESNSSTKESDSESGSESEESGSKSDD